MRSYFLLLLARLAACVRCKALLFSPFLLTLAACQPADKAATASAAAVPASAASAAAQAASAAASQPVVFDDAPTPELAELAAATGIPDSVTAALARSRIPASQISLLVVPADGGAPLVNLHSQRPMKIGRAHV